MRFSFLFLFLCFHIGTSFLYGQTDRDTDSTKRIRFAGIPLVNYNRTLGIYGGGFVSAYYKLNPEDTISPSSNTGIAAITSSSGTYFVAAFQQFYFHEDRWRSRIALGKGAVYFQFYQELPLVGGTFIDFTTDASFAYANLEREIFPDLYGGLFFTYADVETTFDIPLPDSLTTDTRNMNNLGYSIKYDKRNNINYPTDGYQLDFTHSFFRNWIGGESEFDQLEISYTHYVGWVKGRHVLVPRFKMSLAIGDVPFQGQSVVGGDDIRGYTEGRYRGNQLYALQVEYRWNFYGKFGLVAFAGVATATDSFSELGSEKLLPGIGAGFRYRMIEEENINVGFDFGIGVEDWSLSFRIGETFSR